MSRLTDKLEIYAKSYEESPFHREIEGTIELLQEAAKKLKEYEGLEERGSMLIVPEIPKGKTLYWI